mmetsp:Transcript_124893/g.296358  ORF Transcript_124893/g.296358 Transcript_124893/m.296358 type:complete len:206 (+) Transcript_124893:183-800(+)
MQLRAMKKCKAGASLHSEKVSPPASFHVCAIPMSMAIRLIRWTVPEKKEIETRRVAYPGSCISGHLAQLRTVAMSFRDCFAVSQNRPSAKALRSRREHHALLGAAGQGAPLLIERNPHSGNLHLLVEDPDASMVANLRKALDVLQAFLCSLQDGLPQVREELSQVSFAHQRQAQDPPLLLSGLLPVGRKQGALRLLVLRVAAGLG